MMQAEETDAVSEIIASIQLQKDVHVKDEIRNYQAYSSSIGDESEYIHHLVRLIRPDKALALFSICVELCVSDGVIAASEATLLEKIALALTLEVSARKAIEDLVLQLQALDNENEF